MHLSHSVSIYSNKNLVTKPAVLDKLRDFLYTASLPDEYQEDGSIGNSAHCESAIMCLISLASAAGRAKDLLLIVKLLLRYIIACHIHI